jgi:hypothetical protein
MNKKKGCSIRRVTLKQVKLINGMLSGLSVAAAARKAGYSESSARSTVYTMLNNLPPKPELIDLMMSRGITPERIAQVLDECLEARKIIPAHIPRRGRKSKDSRVVTIKVPDYRARLRATNIAIKLYGYFFNKE